MFLTLATTGTDARPASDLGFLLHKHPEKAQRFDVSHGTAHVFYPEANAARCTAALLLDVDPVSLVRGRGAQLAQYVNDRPYAASSLLAVALGKVFRTALKGECAARPELAASALPLRVEVPALPARGGPELVRRLFEPLGWTVDAEPVPLDAAFPAWGDSPYVRLALDGTARLADALRQLYVLLPVLDAAKHYWITADEVDKLLRAGDGWLESHPEQRLIAARYLARRAALTRQALERLELARLAEADDAEAEELDNAVADEADVVDQVDQVDDEPGNDPGSQPADQPREARRQAGPQGRTAQDRQTPPDQPAPTRTPGAGTAEEKPVPLSRQRRRAIAEALREAGASRVLDLGCGGGELLRELLEDRDFTELVGVDVSVRALQIARRRLRLDRLPERQRQRLTLLQGSLVYTDARLAGYDAAVLCEVIEHVDPPRLPALEFAVFGAARPRTVVVTTPNAEYNVRFETLPAGAARHADHRFEWRRDEFRRWADSVAERHGYAVAFRPVGPDDPDVGPPTQLALFTAIDTAKEAAA